MSHAQKDLRDVSVIFIIISFHFKHTFADVRRLASLFQLFSWLSKKLCGGKLGEVLDGWWTASKPQSRNSHQQVHKYYMLDNFVQLSYNQELVNQSQSVQMNSADQKQLGICINRKFVLSINLKCAALLAHPSYEQCCMNCMYKSTLTLNNHIWITMLAASLCLCLG